MTEDTTGGGRGGRVTLAAVAADAGVSVATVSKVLNGRGTSRHSPGARCRACWSATGTNCRSGDARWASSTC
ncbi:LacI family DNA-binding transcriptional regulator [Kitasatospora paranensis]|uniref:LacI family DNA-binding transcriptional regulator n=1 Tax=Kitasatospora paranensis TaxID=258053 RepID=UPI003CD09F27